MNNNRRSNMLCVMYMIRNAEGLYWGDVLLFHRLLLMLFVLNQVLCSSYANDKTKESLVQTI